MAITYPLTLPTATGFKELVLTPESMVALTESPWTGKQQVQANQGKRFLLDVKLPVMELDDAAEWETFFLKLDGIKGTFLCGDPARATPRGVGTGTPLVNGASQIGQELVTDGWTPSTNGILLKNDWIQLGGSLTARLYRVLEDVNSDGSGNATLSLWPAITLANSPADNATIVLNNTVGLFRMVDPVRFPINTALLSEYSFNAMSVV